MLNNKRFYFTVALLLCCLFVLTSTAYIKTSFAYPKKAITILIPWAAGGTSDTLARAIASVAPKYMDQPIIVVNKPGGSGTIATTEVAHARPDGYTLLLVASGPLSTQPNLMELQYDPKTDLRGVIGLTFLPAFLAVHADSPWKTLEDFIEAAKKEKLRYSTTGTGSVQHLAAEDFLSRAGLSMTMVPFKGGSPAVTALLGKHVDMTVANASEVVSGYQAGTLRILGVMSTQREEGFPEIPTFKELGYDIVRGVVQCILAPASVDYEIVEYLHDTFKKIMEDKEYVDLMKNIKMPIVYLNPKDLEDRYNSDREAYAKVVKSLGM